MKTLQAGLAPSEPPQHFRMIEIKCNVQSLLFTRFLGLYCLGFTQLSWAPLDSPLTVPPPPGDIIPGTTALGRGPSVSGVTTSCICAQHLASPSSPLGACALRVSHEE